MRLAELKKYIICIALTVSVIINIFLPVQIYNNKNKVIDSAESQLKNAYESMSKYCENGNIEDYYDTVISLKSSINIVDALPDGENYECVKKADRLSLLYKYLRTDKAFVDRNKEDILAVLRELSDNINSQNPYAQILNMRDN